jgi:hypothetical protein
MASSPSFKLLDEEGHVLEQCSAGIVSDDGHILSQGHCLEKCLARAHLYKDSPDGSVVDKSKLANLKCTLSINDKKMEAHVLAINDCASFDEANFKTVTPVCNGLDYVLLKVDAKDLADFTCLKINKSVLARDTPVAALHLPGERTLREAYRQGAHWYDTNGKTQVMSLGNVIAPQRTCNLKIDPQDRGQPQPGPVALGTARSTDALMNYVQLGTLVQTTVDILHGSSGGTLMNSQGQIVGTASMFISVQSHQSIMMECEGSTFFTPLSAVWPDIQKRFPNLDLDSAVNCSRKSSIKSSAN